MAAAVIPALEAVAPEIISLITGLVHKAAPAAEQQYGPKTGPVKFADVFGQVITALQNAAKAGQIDKALPSDQTVQLIIQSVVSSMNLSGMLTGAPASTMTNKTTATGFSLGVGSQNVILSAGQTLTVTVK